MKQRIVGYDLARALAVFGMVVVNFKIVMGAEDSGPTWLVDLVGLLSGRAAAIFVVLAGVGVSLISKKARVLGDRALLQSDRTVLLKRALFLFVVGLLYTPVWPADILHFYGIYLASSALLLSASTRRLLTLSGVLVATAAIMILFLDYGQGWDWKTLEYSGFWSPMGMVRHLFFNGFHPVVPWLSFLLVGMVLGRQDIQKASVRRRIFILGVIVAGVAEAGSRLLIRTLSESHVAAESETIVALFGTGPMPPMPLYVFAAAGTACAVIVAMVSVGLRYGEAIWLRPFVATGQLALSLYVGHVLVGMGALELMGRLENQTLPFSLLASMIFCIAGVQFSYLWRRRFERGPIEAIMRMCTGQIWRWPEK